MTAGYPGDSNRRLRLTKAAGISLLLVMFLSLALARPQPAIAQTAPPSAPVQSVAPASSFIPSSCPRPLNLPDGFVAGETARCGTVSVPQSRSRPNLPPLTLPVVVFTSPSVLPDATPVLYLAGGPGGSGIREVARGFLDSPLGLTLVRERPVIAFDQRGTGSALPSLECPTMSEIRTDAAAIMSNARPTPLERVRACRGVLESRGIDLGSFNTTETSHDVQDIIHALGYQRAILVGASYGTTGVLFTLRNHPDVVAAAILDGVAPPQWLDGYERDVLEMEADLAFRRFLDDCADDPICGAAYPDLGDLFARLEARGNDRLRILNPNDGSGEALEISYRTLAELFREMITDPVIAGWVPRFVSAALRGETDLLVEQIGFGLVIAAIFDEPSDTPQTRQRALQPLYDAVLCADFPTGTPFGGRPVCDAWGVAYLGGQVSAPVVSDVPVLLLSGNYDFQTPPHWAEDTARNLRNSHAYVLPAAGHVVMYSQHAACVTVLVLSFVADPIRRPVDGCVREALGPRFVVTPDRPIT
jgi:pimeloyl-ACP methyl ester carboxylesterase